MSKIFVGDLDKKVTVREVLEIIDVEDIFASTEVFKEVMNSFAKVVSRAG